MNNETISCYLCGQNHTEKYPGSVRDNKDLQVIKCLSCGLIFLSSFRHITENYYEGSNMLKEQGIDFDVWKKETERDDIRRSRYLRPLLENKDVLDIGAGNGGFLVNIRNIARSVSGVEPDEKVRDHYKCHKINHFNNYELIENNYDVITLFHVLEHMKDPRFALTKLKDRLNDNGKIICEVPNAEDALLSIYHCRGFSEFTFWSCHLFHFNRDTLGKLAEQSGLKVDYIKQLQRYPLSNHLHWLSNNKPGGHEVWYFLDSQELHSAYEKQLASIGCCDTLIASFSAIK